jgi:hypothetical protein
VTVVVKEPGRAIASSVCADGSPLRGTGRWPRSPSGQPSSPTQHTSIPTLRPLVSPVTTSRALLQKSPGQRVSGQTRARNMARSMHLRRLHRPPADPRRLQKAAWPLGGSHCRGRVAAAKRPTGGATSARANRHAGKPCHNRGAAIARQGATYRCRRIRPVGIGNRQLKISVGPSSSAADGR